MRSTLILFGYFVVFNIAGASDSVIWQKEIEAEPNSVCRPYKLMVDNKNKEVIIIGTAALPVRNEYQLRL